MVRPLSIENRLLAYQLLAVHGVASRFALQLLPISLRHVEYLKTTPTLQRTT